MDSVDVEVHLPKWVGTPNVSLTAKELGVWELVHLNAKTSFDSEEVAQNGRCNFVKELHVRVDFNLKYFVAKDFEDNKAKAAGNKGLANFYAWLQLRVKKHAAEHYAQFGKVILAWKGDIKQDLVKRLPTKKRPTSLTELEIKEGIGALVTDWVAELNFRLNKRAFEYEKLDYPHIQAEMKENLHNPIQTLSGTMFSFPPEPQSPAARRKITFPACRP